MSRRAVASQPKVGSMGTIPTRLAESTGSFTDYPNPPLPSGVQHQTTELDPDHPMNLRLDHLLEELRCNPAAILQRIDSDPLLVKRVSGDLVLANAGPLLFTPQEPHQLLAKGVVYRRDPFELVSLPLVKIYNLGERNVSVHDLSGLGAATVDGIHPRLHFLRKLDGTLIQRFQHAGRVYFTTRGMIEGGPGSGPQDEDALPRQRGFDFLGAARRVAAERYPALLEPQPKCEGLTLVFEFLHPETRVITNYGDRQDLVLLAVFDRAEWRYQTYTEVRDLARTLALIPVDEFAPPGATLAEQIDSLLASIAGTDQEGTVITIEHGYQVVYRVKVKSPDYLRVLKLVVTCTYARVVEMVDAHPHWQGWADLEAHLRNLGREQVPEEVLGFYHEHYETLVAYLTDCERLRQWAGRAVESLRHEIAATDRADPRRLRKAFAARATQLPHTALLFAGFDGRLNLVTVRGYVRTLDEARAAVRNLPG